jgi:protein-tyrosine-phosphatase
MADANSNNNGGKNKKGSIGSVATAQEPGQVKILKRTNSPVPPKSFPGALPTLPAAASANAVGNNTVPGITAKEVEECVARAMASFSADQSRLMQKTLQEEMCPKLISAMDASSKKQAPQMSRAVATQVSADIKDPVTEAFHSSMREVMIPAFEAASQQMFQQVSTAVETHLGVLQQKVQKDETSSRQMTEMAACMTKLVHTVESLSVEVSQLRKQVADSSIAASLSVPPGVSAPPGMGGQSRQPQPPADPFAGLRQEMLLFLNAQNYEVAFTKALSSNNAELTKFCCRNADLALVLGGSEGGAVLLSQPILLCIVQQLGSTLATSPPHAADVKMELEWMQEIALSLNASDPTIRQHVPQVMSQLDGNIQTKLNQGDPALRRPLQMLLQVLRGISH